MSKIQIVNLPGHANFAQEHITKRMTLFLKKLSDRRKHQLDVEEPLSDCVSAQPRNLSSLSKGSVSRWVSLPRLSNWLSKRLQDWQAAISAGHKAVAARAEGSARPSGSALT